MGLFDLFKKKSSFENDVDKTFGRIVQYAERSWGELITDESFNNLMKQKGLNSPKEIKAFLFLSWLRKDSINKGLKLEEPVATELMKYFYDLDESRANVVCRAFDKPLIGNVKEKLLWDYLTGSEQKGKC